MWFKVAEESQYLVITGAWIKDMKLAKKARILPGQSCTILDTSHVLYTIQLKAMSADKVLFILPAVFTIGPDTENKESLLKCAKLMSSHDDESVKYLVEGILQGKTRVLAASLTIEQIFQVKPFNDQLFDNAQLQLNQFGLIIYDATVQFSYPGQKTQMEAANQAKVNVSEARRKGEVGANFRYGQTLQNAAKQEIKVGTEVKVYEKQGCRRRKAGGQVPSSSVAFSNF